MWFDATIVEAVVDAIPSWASLLLFLVSFLGSVYVVVPGVVLACWLGDRRRTATWPGTVLCAYASFVAVKPAVSTSRPPVDPPFARDALPQFAGPLYDLGLEFTSASFPSGHVVAATAFWGLVAADTRFAAARTRTLLAGAIVALVGLSRVALGVHFVGDVLGGFAIGLGVLVAAFAIRRPARNPATAMAGVACVPAVAGLGTGRTGDALLLLAAAGGLLLALGYGAGTANGDDRTAPDRDPRVRRDGQPSGPPDADSEPRTDRS